MPEKTTRLTIATLSSLAAGITGWSPPSTWPRLDTNRWCWSAARNQAAPPSPKNFIPASAVLRWRIRRVRCVRDIVRDMQLEKHGLKMIAPEVAVTALSPDGRLSFSTTMPKKSRRKLRSFRRRMPRSIPSFKRRWPEWAKSSAKRWLSRLPTSITQFRRSLGHAATPAAPCANWASSDMYRLLRWGPMAVADLVAEYFETELVRATIAARGIFGTFLGPWSAGSSLVLLIRAAGDEHPAGSAWFAEGGMGAVTQAMAAAAQQAGAEIRSGVEVIEVRVKDGVTSGVVLSTGEEITAKAVVSNADPKRTLLKLVDPAHLSPDFVMKLQHYRMPGTVAKVNLALSGLPKFTALEGEGHDRALSGRIHIGPEIDYLERAFDESKYGSFSKQPYLEVAIPSLSDSSLAPAGKHVMSIYMQYAPFKLKGTDWEKQRVPLGDTVVKTLAQYAPNLPELILSHQIITPMDLEETYGLTGGHIFHGELALDQFFTMRPLLDWGRYNTPIQNLYLCGSGTHPGRA